MVGVGACVRLPDVSWGGSQRPPGGRSSPLWSSSAHRSLGCRQSVVKQHWWASAHVSCPVPTTPPTCRSVTGSLLPVELHSCVIPNLRAIAPVRRDPRVHFCANKRFTTGGVLCELARVACVSAAVGDPADWRAVELPRSGRKLEGHHLELCEALVHRRKTWGESRHPRLAAIFLCITYNYCTQQLVFPYNLNYTGAEMLWTVVCVVAVLGAAALLRAYRRKPFSLKGCHVLVTGGSSGIGKAVALEAVRRGASVTLLARNEARSLLHHPKLL